MYQLALIGLALLIAHMSVPLGYYSSILAGLRAGVNPLGGRPRRSANRLPTVSIIVPTYNERENIVEKLSNIADETAELGGAEVIVIDGNSTDGTAEVAEGWKAPPWVKLKVVRESSRRGKHVAENCGLRVSSGDIVVFSDADCLWAPGSLRNAVEALSSEGVGLVTCVKRPAGGDPNERAYRDLYNMVRLGESKLHSTPIAHGELLAIRRDLLASLGGLRPGADDSDLAHRVAMRGLRSVALPNVVCVEKVPRGHGYVEWRLRRAQHLVAHFARSLRDLRRAPRGYGAVLAVEAYLHLFNEWVALAALVLLAAAAVHGSLLADIVLALLAIALAISSEARSWAASQAFLVLASVRNLFNREEVWRKVNK